MTTSLYERMKEINGFTGNFINPYAGDDGYISLGTRYVSDLGVAKTYDLYALVSPSASRIDFGARFGNEPEEYLSGEAYRKDNGEWELYVGGETAIAAARYFANVAKPPQAIS